MPKPKNGRVKSKAKPKKKLPRKPKTGSRSKRFSFKDSSGNLKFLTKKQYEFATSYLNSYGKRVDSVIEAGYEVYLRDKKGNLTNRVNVNLARSIAGENLRKPVICAFITSKMAKYGWDDDNVELQHLSLINQQDNLPTKQRAIADWYKLKNKYPTETLLLSGTVEVVEVTRYAPKDAPRKEKN